MSTSKRSRRQLTTDQKVAMIERGMVDKVPVSALCSEQELAARTQERVATVAKNDNVIAEVTAGLPG